MILLELLTERQESGLLCIGFSEGGRQGSLSKEFKSPTFVDWSDLTIINGDLLASDKPISSFSKVLVGAVGDHVALRSCLKAYLSRHKIPSLAYGSSTEDNNKLLQSVQLEALGVSQIKTVIGSGKSLTAAQLVKTLKLPLVSKITDGSQGKGIKKHETEETLKKLLSQDPDKLYIFQEFVPNDGDFRAFYIKNQLVYVIKRTRQSKTEFRNNVSLGGKQEDSSLPPAAEKIARKAVQAMKFDVTGVDLIQHQDTKEWYIMEVNSAPQFDGPEFEMVMKALISQLKNV